MVAHVEAARALAPSVPHAAAPALLQNVRVGRHGRRLQQQADRTHAHTYPARCSACRCCWRATPASWRLCGMRRLRMVWRRCMMRALLRGSAAWARSWWRHYGGRIEWVGSAWLSAI